MPRNDFINTNGTINYDNIASTSQITNIIVRASVMDYGAIGDGVTDDTSAIMNAVNTGKDVYFPRGHQFVMTGTVNVTTSNQRFFGGGTICCSSTGIWITPPYNILFNVTANGVSFDNIIFDGKNAYFNMGSPFPWISQYGWLRFNSTSDCAVTNCTFINQSSANAYQGLLGGCTSIESINGGSRFKCINNLFKNLSGGAVYIESPGSIIANNQAYNLGDAGYILHLNTATNCVIENNYIEKAPTGISIEVGPTDYIIQGNNIKNCSNAIFLFEANGTNVHQKGIIKNNLVDNTTIVSGSSYGVITQFLSTNPSAVSQADNIVIEGNYFLGCSSGITLNMGQTFLIRNNYFEVVNTFNGITVYIDNFNSQIIGNVFVYDWGGTGIQFLSSRTNSNAVIKDNIFRGGGGESTGVFIDGTWTGMLQDNIVFATVLFHLYTGTTCPWGDITTLTVKHIYSNLTTGKSEVFATAAPTTGTWIVGDKCYNSTPTAGGYLGWVCTVTGTPGTWKGFGTIQA